MECGRARLASAVASWQPQWLENAQLAVYPIGLVNLREAVVQLESQGALTWVLNKQVWMWALPCALSALTARVLGLSDTSRETPALELLQAVEEQWIEALLEAVQSTGIPVDTPNPTMFLRQAVRADDLPQEGCHFELRDEEGHPLFTLLCGADWLRAQALQTTPQRSEPGLTARIPALESSSVRLSAILGRCKLTAAQLATLEVGDVITLERRLDEPAALEFEAQGGTPGPMFASVELGRSGGRLSVQLTSIANIEKS